MTETGKRNSEITEKDHTPARIPEGEPPENYVDLAKDYPVALIAGGLAIGVIAGALLPRGFGRKFARSAVSIALTAGELGRNYGNQVIDVASDGSRESRKKLGNLGDAVSELGGRVALSASDRGRKGRSIGHKAAREAIRIVANLRR